MMVIFCSAHQRPEMLSHLQPKKKTPTLPTSSMPVTHVIYDILKGNKTWQIKIGN